MLTTIPLIVSLKDHSLHIYGSRSFLYLLFSSLNLDHEAVQRSILDQALLNTLMKSERISQKDVIEQALEQKHRVADLKLEALVSRMKNRLAKKIIETNKREEERIIYETLQDRLSQPNYLDYVTTTLYDIDDQYGYFNQHRYSTTGHDNRQVTPTL